MKMHPCIQEALVEWECGVGRGCFWECTAYVIYHLADELTLGAAKGCLTSSSYLRDKMTLKWS